MRDARPHGLDLPGVTGNGHPHKNFASLESLSLYNSWHLNSRKDYHLLYHSKLSGYYADSHLQTSVVTDQARVKK